MLKLAIDSKDGEMINKIIPIIKRMISTVFILLYLFLSINFFIELLNINKLR